MVSSFSNKAKYLILAKELPICSDIARKTCLVWVGRNILFVLQGNLFSKNLQVCLSFLMCYRVGNLERKGLFISWFWEFGDTEGLVPASGESHLGAVYLVRIHRQERHIHTEIDMERQRDHSLLIHLSFDHGWLTVLSKNTSKRHHHSTWLPWESNFHPLEYGSTFISQLIFKICVISYTM